MSKRQKLLNDSEKALLLDCLREYAPYLLNKVDPLYKGLVDSDTVNEMRNAIGDELINKGFMPNDEPNRYGLELESLIDRLADLYIWPEERNQR